MKGSFFSKISSIIFSCVLVYSSNGESENLSLEDNIAKNPELCRELFDKYICKIIEKGERCVVKIVGTKREVIPFVDSKSRKKKEKKKTNLVKNVIKTTRVVSYGFVISDNGYIVTDYSLINGVNNLEIYFKYSEKAYSASIVGYDKYYDIALLKVDLTKLDYLELNDYGENRSFKYKYKIGNAMCVRECTAELEVSKNKRSKKSNLITYDSYSNANGMQNIFGLISIYGDLIGIKVNGGKFSYKEGSIIPQNELKMIIDELKNNGYAIHKYKHFSIVEVDSRMKTRKHLKVDYGCIIETISDELIKYGFRKGDVIVGINNKRIKCLHDFDVHYGRVKNDDLNFEIDRNGKMIKISVRSGVCSDITYERKVNCLFVNGADIRDLSSAQIDQFSRNSNFKGGVFIDSFVNGKAWECGDKFVITRIGEKNVSSISDVVEIFKNTNKDCNYEYVPMCIHGFKDTNPNDIKCFVVTFL